MAKKKRIKIDPDVKKMVKAAYDLGYFDGCEAREKRKTVEARYLRDAASAGPGSAVHGASGTEVQAAAVSPSERTAAEDRVELSGDAAEARGPEMACC